MFSTGQIVFALLFAVGFIAVIVFTYRKDKKLHSKNYKGVQWIALAFIIFILLLFFIKYMLKP